MLTKYAPYLLAVSLFILGSSIGFFIGKTTYGPKELSNSAQNTPNENSGGYDALFDSQSATIRGVITKKGDGVITVRRLNNQTTGVLNTSKRLIVADANKVANASPSASLDNVQLDKEAVIFLEKFEGKYQVVLIQYTLPAPSLPPIKTPAQ